MTATTKLKLAAGVGVAVLIACGSYVTVREHQALAETSRQLELTRQEARQQAAAQQAAIDTLKQEKLALVAEKQRDEAVTAKLLQRQRAETDAAVARAEAAKARADAAARNAMFSALGELWTDPANREMMRLGYREDFKSRFTDLANRLKLSTEDADKLFDLLTTNKLKGQDRLGAMWQKKLDVTTALQMRDDDKKEMENQLRSSFGEDALAQYREIQLNTFADDSIGTLNRELGNNRLNDDQVKRLKEIIRAHPEIPMTAEDMFRSRESTEALIQQLTARSEAVRQAAAAVLTPEQLATATTVSANQINLLRTQLGLAKQLFLKDTNPQP